MRRASRALFRAWSRMALAQITRLCRRPSQRRLLRKRPRRRPCNLSGRRGRMGWSARPGPKESTVHVVPQCPPGRVSRRLPGMGPSSTAVVVAHRFPATQRAWWAQRFTLDERRSAWGAVVAGKGCYLGTGSHVPRRKDRSRQGLSNPPHSLLPASGCKFRASCAGFIGFVTASCVVRRLHTLLRRASFRQVHWVRNCPGRHLLERKMRRRF